MDETGLTDVPALVPARMLNEYVYCPRLFYLEWVQARFEDNPDTVDGRYRHRVVDVGGGRMEPAGTDDPVSRARSVTLGSERLGLIAKADLIEGADGTVVPVEVKRGRPPGDAPAWAPERIQLCAIGLLLRDNGYEVDHGEFYFAETRERTTLWFDEDLIAETTATLTALRAVAAASDAPPPLIDSKKCPRCSLVGICLPDETNLHRERSAHPPRRLTPRESAARPLYVTTQGASIGVREGRIIVSKDRVALESVRAIDVSHVAVFGNVSLSAQLMRACFRDQIPVCWFSYGGWFQGIAQGLPSKHVDLHIRQVGTAARGALPIARRMVEGKIRNTRAFLRRNTRTELDDVLSQLRDLAAGARDAESPAALLGIEGTAARLYFARFSGMLRNDALGTFDFAGRNRRPPRDAVNCLLSFAYALLVRDLTATTLAVGLDPYLGVFHRPRFGRPALALDLAEEFRPLIAESVVVNAINNGEVSATDFVRRAHGVALTQKGRIAMIRAHERRLDHEIKHPVYGYRITYRRVLEVQARTLAAHMLGEIPDYVPFVTR